MEFKEPYFMKNKDWYYFDEDEFCYKIKEDAPQKAKDSYEKYYAELNMKNWVE